jgi:hypothetical protein
MVKLMSEHPLCHCRWFLSALSSVE